MKIMIINGPNINMQGIRERDIYGTITYDEMISTIKKHALLNNVQVNIQQSNHEGVIIDLIQEAYYKHYDGLIINPGGYTHTSIAIRDAILSVDLPVIEVHLTNPDDRESFRQINYIKDIVEIRFLGHGVDSYLEAIDYLNK